MIEPSPIITENKNMKFLFFVIFIFSPLAQANVDIDQLIQCFEETEISVSSGYSSELTSSVSFIGTLDEQTSHGRKENIKRRYRAVVLTTDQGKGTRTYVFQGNRLRSHVIENEKISSSCSRSDTSANILVPSECFKKVSSQSCERTDGTAYLKIKIARNKRGEIQHCDVEPTFATAESGHRHPSRVQRTIAQRARSERLLSLEKIIGTQGIEYDQGKLRSALSKDGSCTKSLRPMPEGLATLSESILCYENQRGENLCPKRRFNPGRFIREIPRANRGAPPIRISPESEPTKS